MLGTDMVKGERIDELEEITIETIKNKTQGKKRLKINDKYQLYEYLKKLNAELKKKKPSHKEKLQAQMASMVNSMNI